MYLNLPLHRVQLEYNNLHLLTIDAGTQNKLKSVSQHYQDIKTDEIQKRVNGSCGDGGGSDDGNNCGGLQL